MVTSTDNRRRFSNRWSTRYTGCSIPPTLRTVYEHKTSIRHHHGEDKEPSWHLYQEAFEKDDVVYLELEGVQADIVMIDSAWAKAGTVLLRLPNATAHQLGLLPHSHQANAQPVGK